jgi:hypothetical protein
MKASRYTEAQIIAILRQAEGGVLFTDPALLRRFVAHTGGFNARHLGAAARSVQALTLYLVARHR